jgi:hypothetical protein
MFGKDGSKTHGQEKSYGLGGNGKPEPKGRNNAKKFMAYYVLAVINYFK